MSVARPRGHGAHMTLFADGENLEGGELWTLSP